MRKAALLVLLLALAVTLASVGAGWKWGGKTTKNAGWTWDDGRASYVWTE